MEKNTNTSSGSFKNTPHIESSTDMKPATNVGGKSEMIDNVKNRITQQAGPAMESLRSGLRGFQDTSRPYVENASTYVRQYPLAAVFGGIAVGALLGMWIARPSNRV